MARQKNDEKTTVGGVAKFSDFSKSKGKNGNRELNRQERIERRAPSGSPPHEEIAFCPSASYIPTHRSSRGRYGDRPSAVNGHTLKVNVSASRPTHSMTFIHASDTQGSYYGRSQAAGPYSHCGTHAGTTVT